MLPCQSRAGWGFSAKCSSQASIRAETCAAASVTPFPLLTCKTCPAGRTDTHTGMPK